MPINSGVSTTLSSGLAIILAPPSAGWSSPPKGFADLEQARAWAADLVHWYNHEHRHSGIRYVSPAPRHASADTAILAACHELYCQPRDRNPRRWSGATRNWTPIEAVTLNPERDSVVKTHSSSLENQPLAA